MSVGQGNIIYNAYHDIKSMQAGGSTNNTNVENFSIGNFVGISEEGLKTVINNIVEYANGVQKILSEFATDAQPSTAFKGEQYEKAIAAFTDAVKTEANEYVSRIKHYCTVIEEKVIAGAKTEDASVSDVINNASSTVEGLTEEYNYAGGESGSAS